eukprot:TRINITY_DN78241_c0_g1_i1.p1 TRINITY_DN78241_c0_g1~~TRINITY_DN78241_c0_g1_i1.p1  ORF type:complete len:391 (-),score=39.27 TRINITY_DN78241_c0_g1_i1:114-1286(-)
MGRYSPLLAEAWLYLEMFKLTPISEHRKRGLRTRHVLLKSGRRGRHRALCASLRSACRLRLRSHLKRFKEVRTELRVGYIQLPLPCGTSLAFSSQRLVDLLDVSSAGFFHQVAPWLSIENPCIKPDMQLLGESRGIDGLATVAKLRSQGYARLRRPWAASTLSNGTLSGIAAGIAALRRHGAHPIWILAYDEAWLLLWEMQTQIFSSLGLHGLSINHDVMAWYIDPVSREAGWPEHQDRAIAQDPLDYVTCWVALTDSTQSNGCIRVRPTASANNERLLTASTGDCLLWHGLTPHRGGRAVSRRAEPRISLSCGASRPALEDPALRLRPADREAFARGELDEVRLPARVRLIALILWLNDFLIDGPAKALLEELDAAEESGGWPNERPIV